VRSLDGIVKLLNRYHQRATYGAVAELVGGVPRAIMQGRPRNWLHSWVVNQETGLPSEYPAPKIHPAIDEQTIILCDAGALAAWLDAHK
jgi:hypothetical protein